MHTFLYDGSMSTAALQTVQVVRAVQLSVLNVAPAVVVVVVVRDFVHVDGKLFGRVAKPSHASLSRPPCQKRQNASARRRTRKN